MTGTAALIRRGTCSFYIKASNAQQAGAAAVVLYNNAPGDINPTVAGSPAITIPVVAINAADGAGYDLLASVVLKLDPKNPQLAARLAGNFKSYKVLEQQRRDHAEAALKRIAAASGLSRDTYEIVTRTLGA